VCGDDRGARHGSSIVEPMFDINGFSIPVEPCDARWRPDGDAE
jgi:hypothetical protein